MGVVTVVFAAGHDALLDIGWRRPGAASPAPGSEDLVGVLLVLLLLLGGLAAQAVDVFHLEHLVHAVGVVRTGRQAAFAVDPYRTDSGRHRQRAGRSEEHTSELQSLMRISYAVFCL